MEELHSAHRRPKLADLVLRPKGLGLLQSLCSDPVTGRRAKSEALKWSTGLGTWTTCTRGIRKGLRMEKQQLDVALLPCDLYVVPLAGPFHENETKVRLPWYSARLAERRFLTVHPCPQVGGTVSRAGLLSLKYMN